jgi:putative flippase GtrA
MFRWRTEVSYARRHAGAGVLNTAVGFCVIFLLTWFGVRPVEANVAGYLVGLLMGFAVSKVWVFRSGGGVLAEGTRYMIAFVISFLGNLLVLHYALLMPHMHVLVAQLFAAVAYTLLMYIGCRLFVFGKWPA